MLGRIVTNTLCIVLPWVVGILPGVAEVPDKLIRIGFSAELFNEVSLDDAQVAMQIWSQSVTDLFSSGYRGESVIFHDRTDALESVEKEEVDMIGLTSMDYLAIRDEVTFLEPATVGFRSGDQPLESYLLLVRRDANISRLGHLRDLDMVVGLGANNRIALMWLDVELMKESLPVASKLLGIVNMVERPSKAVLPVFFGQSDLCLVRKLSFETMVEFNPQIGQQLEALAVSPGYLPDLMCFRRKWDDETKALILRSAEALHTKADGKQMLRLFQTERIGTFKPSYLANLLHLVSAYEKLAADPDRTALPN